MIGSPSEPERWRWGEQGGAGLLLVDMWVREESENPRGPLHSLCSRAPFFDTDVAPSGLAAIRHNALVIGK